jgi:hypothetical protein
MGRRRGSGFGFSGASGLKSGQFDRKTDSSVVESDTSGSRWPKKTASLIKKETFKKLISNVEGMYPVYFIKKRLSAAIPPFNILRFDIRYSAVRF